MHYWKLVVTLAALSALIAACSDDDGGSGDRTPGVGETDPAGGTPLKEDVVFDIVANDFFFEPNTFEAHAGDVARVNFTNEGAESHTMTVFRDEAYLDPLEGATTGVEEGIALFTFLATFDQPGTYYFRCDFHPTDMKGTIEVQ